MLLARMLGNWDGCRRTELEGVDGFRLDDAGCQLLACEFRCERHYGGVVW
jgi:hypothetical protein